MNTIAQIVPSAIKAQKKSHVANCSNDGEKQRCVPLESGKIGKMND
jgi:hypothetical protein